MTDKKAPILQIPAYRTLDGKQFYDLAEAQAHTRDGYLMSLVKGLQKEDPKFARLNDDLLVEALKRLAPRATTILNDGLEPAAQSSEAQDLYEEAARRLRLSKTPVSAELSAAAADRAVGKPAELAMPYGKGPNPDIFANARTFPEGGYVGGSPSGLKPGEVGAEVIRRPDPLKSAMQRVDENMAEEEDEITRQIIAGISPEPKRMVG